MDLLHLSPVTSFDRHVLSDTFSDATFFNVPNSWMMKPPHNLESSVAEYFCLSLALFQIEPAFV